MPKIAFQNAAFMTSAQRLSQCPPDVGNEVAFAGRSNAGKSSAINCITSQHKLARTSKTPGRTQLINFFALAEQQRLVDLPGYGYAKVALKVRDQWQRYLDEYLRERQSLRGLVLLTDIRRPMQEFDMAMLAWSDSCQMPLHVMLTKADKLKYGAAKAQLLQVQKQLQAHPQASCQLFSSLKQTGLEEARRQLSQWLQPEPDATSAEQPKESP